MLRNKHDTAGASIELRRPTTSIRKQKIFRALAASAVLAGSALGLARDNQQPDVFVVNHGTNPYAYDELRVVTANVHSWLSPEGDNNFKQFQRAIAAKKLGVACLQEVRDGPEVQKLVREHNAIFATTKVDLVGRRFGNLIISDSPLMKEQVVSLPHPETNEPRNVIVVRISTDRGPLRLACLHLSKEVSEATIQAQYLENSLQDPVDLAVGDFNLEQPIAPIVGIGRSGRFGRFVGYAPVTADVKTFPDLNSDHQNLQLKKHIDWIVTSCADTLDLEEVQKTTKTRRFLSDHLMTEVMFPLDLCLSGK